MLLIPPGLTGYWEALLAMNAMSKRPRNIWPKQGWRRLICASTLQDTAEERIWGEIIQQNLAEVGINVELNPMDSSTYWTTTFGDQAAENNELPSPATRCNPIPPGPRCGLPVIRWENGMQCPGAMRSMTPYIRTGSSSSWTRKNDKNSMWKCKRSGMKPLTQSGSPTAFAFMGMHPIIAPATTPNGKPQVEFFLPAKVVKG